MTERTIQAGGQFNTQVTVYSYRGGDDLSIILRPESFTCITGEEDHFIEIEFDRIDEFIEMLQELKGEQNSGN